MSKITKREKIIRLCLEAEIKASQEKAYRGVRQMAEMANSDLEFQRTGWAYVNAKFPQNLAGEISDLLQKQFLVDWNIIK